VKKTFCPGPHFALIPQCFLTSTSAVKNYDCWRELGCFRKTSACTNICSIMCENSGRRGHVLSRRLRK